MEIEPVSVDIIQS